MAGAGLLNKVLKAFLGSKTDRDLKELSPIVEKTAQVYQTLQSISNDELRSKTSAFKAKIADKTKASEEKIAELKNAIENDLKLSIQEKEEIYNQIDAIEKEILAKIEEVLL